MVWEIYGVDWVELDAPRRLFLHSLTSIRLVAEKAELEQVDTFWNSGSFEFYGSEQYRRDIPLNSEQSFWKNPSRSSFTDAEMADFERLAAKANETGRGGRGGFIFRNAK